MTTHYPCHRTIAESGHVQCPFCACMNEAKVQNVDQSLPLIGGGRLVITVPVWTCLLCEESWTDWVAERMRDSALRKTVD